MPHRHLLRSASSTSVRHSWSYSLSRHTLGWSRPVSLLLIGHIITREYSTNASLPSLWIQKLSSLVIVSAEDVEATQTFSIKAPHNGNSVLASKIRGRVHYTTHFQGSIFLGHRLYIGEHRVFIKIRPFTASLSRPPHHDTVSSRRSETQRGL